MESAMASDEYLKRIDEHMARGNEHMARGNGIARGNELMAEVRREHELNRAAYTEGMRVISRLTDVIDRVDRNQQALHAQILDHRDETRAQTQAVLKLLDRFGGGEPGPAPA